MSQMCKMISLTTLLAVAFLSGFILRGNLTAGDVLAQTSDAPVTAAAEPPTAKADDRDEVAEANSPVPAATTAPSHVMPILVRGGGSIYVDLPRGFRLRSEDNTRYVYEEADKNAQISNITISRNGRQIYAVESKRERDRFTVAVEYEHDR
jgi:hypothetical protein